MKTTDVLVIGGSAAGMVAALTGKSSWPDKSFTLVKKQKEMMVPCGIPYIFGTLDSVDQNIMPVDTMMGKAGVESIVDEVLKINKESKTVDLAGGETIKYDKLVIATGSAPIKPKWLAGADKENVFTIPKDKVYLEDMKEKIESCKKIVVIGAGFIGVEFSDELSKRGHEVTLVEKLPEILSLAFDVELSERIEELIKSRGVKVITGNGISEITGEEKVNAVKLENGDILECDAVVLSIGYRPNVDLARNAGIYVDKFSLPSNELGTLEKDILPLEAQKRDFITRARVAPMLASTACAEARIAGMNLFKLNIVKTFSGTIAIYSTVIGNTAFGTAGITEARAKLECIDYVTGIFEGIDRHPGNLPGAHRQLVKLIASRQAGVIIGGEVIGGLCSGELTNVIGMAIQNRMTVNSLLTFQIGTHPCLTASPAGYPLIKAAEMIANKLRAL